MSYDVCCGMSYLHTLEPTHVIHGDLKQQNLLVTDRLNIKISDFGLSKWKDYSRTYTHAGILQGTPSHIPPEHWMHGDLSKNEKFDVYSYGILLWEMFTEERAFERRNHVIRSIVMDGERPSLDKLPSNAPFQIADIISACWQQEPPKRPTFMELFSSIKDLIQGDESLSKIKRAVTDVLKVYHGGSDTTQPQSEHGHKMNQVQRKLCSILRRMDQILPQLHQARAITSQDYDEIRSQSTIYDLTKRLIDVLGSKPVTAYESFLGALRVTDQQHLYNLLELGAELNIDHREVLIDNYAYLRKNLNVSDTGLLDHLLQSHVLDEQELHKIQSMITPDERAEQLLQIALRTSQQQYQHFLSALRASGNSFIADQLDDCNQVRQQQQPRFPGTQIIPQSASQLLGPSHYPPLCTSFPPFLVPTYLPPSLPSFYHLPTSSLLPSLSTPYRLPTEKTRVIEPESIYGGGYSMECATSGPGCGKQKTQGLQFLQLPQRCETNASLLGLTNPVELEHGDAMVSGYQNKRANNMISAGPDHKKQRGASQTLISPTSFRNRTGYQNAMQHRNGSTSFLDETTVTVRLVPDWEGEMGGEWNREVPGVAVLGNEVFVARYGVPSITVYNSNNLAFSRLLKISDSVNSCYDVAIAVCSHYNCLYYVSGSIRSLSSGDSQYLHEVVIDRLNLSNHAHTSNTYYRTFMKTIATESIALCQTLHSVSISKNYNLLITLSAEECIVEHTTHGSLVREITLDSSIDNPLHCVQMSDDNFVVSHYGLTKDRVCIVDASGQILRSYDEARESGHDIRNYDCYGLCHLSVDSNNNIFVVDRVNHRVVLLSSTLTLLGTVQSPGHHLRSPVSVCFDEINSRVYIGEESGKLLVLTTS